MGIEYSDGDGRWYMKSDSTKQEDDTTYIELFLTVYRKPSVKLNI